MASLFGRAIFQASRCPILLTSVRCKHKSLPDPLELATGLEKREMLALRAGNDDPFNMKAIKRGVGTKDNPTLVPSAFKSRLLGCICEEDSISVTWMWLHAGSPRRCECGHWYKLIMKPPL